jgi:serine/threonine protein kinase
VRVHIYKKHTHFSLAFAATLTHTHTHTHTFVHGLLQVAVKKFKDYDTTAAEAKTLSRLDHPNIVRFIGVCTTPPVFCIVMEFCPKTLYEVIKHTRIPPTQICEWAHQIADGMQCVPPVMRACVLCCRVPSRAARASRAVRALYLLP